ncbi:hypothetical protein SLEP1_g50867 [Rubroshorea leprosula]|uniref:Uncharacterized protein n=1 Tax=Rubroshorea leprosula TaxID=152421 RepID=A0AAV5M4L0_9ROSI|nr:hypothetical protein SLEP1_g50867 [Rubroshorea leprosula]
MCVSQQKILVLYYWDLNANIPSVTNILLGYFPIFLA